MAKHHDSGRNDRRRALKGVLFDFDGTLTKPGLIDFPAIKREIGCPQNRAILEYIGKQPVKDRAFMNVILERHEERAASASAPNSGAEACLWALKARRIPMGIITRNSLKSIVSALEKFNNISCNDFAAVITRDGILPKPSPEGVFKAAESMGCLAEELIVVGDFRFDVIAGKRAGATTILLTNGESPVMLPEDPEPDHLCGNLTEVLDFLLERITLP